jgi:hypothetical protein
MFSSAFASAFVRPVGGYIGPMRAQAALMAGAWYRVQGSALLIEGARLVGPAGKVYAFASEATAEKWAENAAGAGQREAAIIAGLDADAAAAWKARKRAKLAVIAGRLVDAAARQHDAAKRAALLAESDLCLSKWAQ